MNNWTFQELMHREFFINGNRITGYDIEKEINKYIKNIKFDIILDKHLENGGLYIDAHYESANVSIYLNRYYLINDYEEYLKSVALKIKEVISEELFGVQK